MKYLLNVIQTSILLALLPLIFVSCSTRSGPPKILVFCKTAGYHHASIADGIKAIKKLGAENGFEVDTTINASKFTEDTLKQYSAVVFLSTTGNVLDKYQEADFQRYIEAGGGYVGIHAAADTEYEWGWYGRMVGGYFLNHPGIDDPYPNVQEGVLHVEDSTHASTQFLPEQWKRTDEWYSYKNRNGDVHVLLTIDEDSYKGGADMGYHPMAWYHKYDGGRAFYTGLGHTSESFTEDLYLKHILAGIEYAIGDNELLDYSQATTERVPAANRFTKTALSTGTLFEPTEMTILPNLDILIGQRRGQVLLFDRSDSTLSQVGSLDVYWKTDKPDVNAEEGLLGIKADPNYEENHHVFIYYSPADTSVNRLSRFTFENNNLDTDSETVVLELYSKRNICCHTGGSIAFDKKGLLYLSTGDNSTPFDEPGGKYVSHGYAPLDGRPGHEQYDARRTAGNANDLRGKILRIKVNEDGSYSIPEGNLYPEGKEGTRPEIYVQGDRNPYRISVDQKTGYLYWGEVGPDANVDSLTTRGPKGYDEVNQAREAGFFGWPMFVGNNYPYHRYNYATGESGEKFDPKHPINNSPNNTGIKELPPAQPAFIWYPYDASEEFPSVGTGGRNAMAGPVYYTDMYPEETRLPEYYDGKLFIYEWVRNWIKVVTMRPNGDFSKMEPFMRDIELHALIDLEVGPDGRLYLLEYGSSWFSKNADSGLYRIDFNPGNRKPVVQQIALTKTSGTLPLTVEASVEAHDPEQDALTYIWNFGDGTTKETIVPRTDHTFSEVGDYMVSVEVNDDHGHSVKSNPVSVYAGNAAPVVNIDIEGNSTFYFPDQPVAYSVSVEDADHPEASEDLSSLIVSADYVEGSDLAEASSGHQIMTETMRGRNLVSSLDCKSCHQVNAESIGPAYLKVAQQYEDSSDAVSHLTNKIIQGGSGVWGETMMPAHLDISEADARSIVAWIQSLNDEERAKDSLPASGTVDPTMGKKASPGGMLIISASYTDQGGPNIKPLTGETSVHLINNTLSFGRAQNLDAYSTMSFSGNQLMMVPDNSGSFSFEDIDLTGIQSVTLGTAATEPITNGYDIELRLDSPDGTLIGQKSITITGEKPEGAPAIQRSASIELDPVTDGERHDLYIVSKPSNEQTSGQLILTSFRLNN